MTLQEVLRGGRQCDEDGEEIIMSRQACVEAADALDAKDARIKELEGALRNIMAAYDAYDERGAPDSVIWNWEIYIARAREALK